jgi:hypothetical protein
MISPTDSSRISYIYIYMENPVVDKDSFTKYENSSDPNNTIRLKFNYKNNRSHSIIGSTGTVLQN